MRPIERSLDQASDIDELWPDEVELGAMLRSHYRRHPSPEVMATHLFELRQAADAERAEVVSDRFSRTVLLTSVAACLLVAAFVLVGPLREGTTATDDGGINAPAASINSLRVVETPGPESGGDGQDPNTTPATSLFGSESKSDSDTELDSAEAQTNGTAAPTAEPLTPEPVSTTATTATATTAATEATSQTTASASVESSTQQPTSAPTTSAPDNSASTQPVTTAQSSTAQTSTVQSSTTVDSPVTSAPTTLPTTSVPASTNPSTTAPPTTVPSTNPATTAPPTTASTTTTRPIVCLVPIIEILCF